MSFNGEMLRLARQYRGYTQRDFSDKLKVDPALTSRIENGVQTPTPDFVTETSALLKFPEKFFEQPERIYGLPMSVHPMWRKKASVSQRNVDRAFAEINVRLLQLRILLRSVEHTHALELPSLDVQSYRGGAEEIAGLVRRIWHMPAGPVLDLTGWIERAGIFVFHVPLPDAAMSGVTFRVPGLPPCIFLQEDMPSDRMRLTLAHELGHIVMHRLPTLDMEVEAFRFASAFLMPAKDIQPYFSGKKVDLRLLANLKPEWRVSMQGLLKRASQLEFVSESQTRYLWSQFTVRKLRFAEPPELDVEPESPTLLPKLLRLHLGELKYTPANLCDALAIHEQELLDLYRLDALERRSMLRVVA